jgi:hypothetical protein
MKLTIPRNATAGSIFSFLTSTSDQSKFLEWFYSDSVTCLVSNYEVADLLGNNVAGNLVSISSVATIFSMDILNSVAINNTFVFSGELSDGKTSDIAIYLEVCGGESLTMSTLPLYMADAQVQGQVITIADVVGHFGLELSS